MNHMIDNILQTPRTLFITLSILLIGPLSTRAQSVTTSALGTTSFCANPIDTISVSYTASGTFDAKNVFTVQLSAPDGTFSPSFQNIGSLKSTTSGSIRAGLPTVPSTHYRVRVTASSPYTVGNDNSSDITIGAIPIPNFSISRVAILEDDTVTFHAYGGDSGYSCLWDFGNGASPATSSDSIVTVLYNGTGSKVINLTLTSPLGCTNSIDNSKNFYYYTSLRVFSCHPSIPHDAYIDSTSTHAPYPRPSTVWVVPGGVLNPSDDSSGIVFAEPGSTVSGGWGGVFYLKDGAAYNGLGGGNVIIYSAGAGLTNGQSDILLPCSSLIFDYTNAPPYKISWADVGQEKQANAKISIYPNPASKLITIKSSKIPHSVSVRNELGVEMLSDAGPIVTNELLFDVTRFASGVYYVTLDIGGRTESLKFTVSR